MEIHTANHGVTFYFFGKLLVRSDFFIKWQAKSLSALPCPYTCIIRSILNLWFVCRNLRFVHFIRDHLDQKERGYSINLPNGRTSQYAKSRTSEDKIAGSLPTSSQRSRLPSGVLTHTVCWTLPSDLWLSEDVTASLSIKY